MMKAIQIETFGGIEKLQYKEVPDPVPAKGEVLVHVTAVGVNFADTMRRQDQYVVDTPLPFIPGSEVAGTVAEDGKRFKAGTRVVALTGTDAYAERVRIREDQLVEIPETMSDHEAVSLPLQGLSAYHILSTMGRLEEGESVLIHAAAGGVGTLAVQLARHFKAGTVIATASTEEKRALAASLGADVTIDYTKDNWTDEVLAATDGKGVDVALEMVGGDIFDQTLEVLAPFGRLVFFGAASGQLPSLNPFALLEHNKSVIGFFLPQMMAKPDLFAKSLAELFELAASGKLKLSVGPVYSLRDAPKAHDDLENRRTSGKVILEP